MALRLGFELIARCPQQEASFKHKTNWQILWVLKQMFKFCGESSFFGVSEVLPAWWIPGKHLADVYFASEP